MIENNEYKKYPTISRLSMEERDVCHSNHISNIELLRRIECLETDMKTMSTLLAKIILKLDGNEDIHYELQRSENVQKTNIIEDKNPLNYNIGDIIKFGRYGNYDIEWTVLDKKDDSVFILSKYILDQKEYNNDFTNGSWTTSSIRSWLNIEFINLAFNNEEKSKINPTNRTRTITSLSMNDKVFLLHESEVLRYLKTGDKKKACYLSQKAGSWYLAPEGYNSKLVSYIDAFGKKGVGSGKEKLGIRPACWIRIK